MPTKRSPYDFSQDLKSETIQILKRDGSPVVTITCWEATGKEAAALAIISRVENAACDAFLESRGGKIEKLPNGRDVWKFPDDARFTLDENNFLSFRRRVYPKLLACSTCDLERLPTAQEAWSFPEKELDKWYASAAKVNPAWFDEFRQTSKQQILEEMANGQGAKVYKKKSKPR